MLRRLIRIDEEKCNGCGLCAGACHEGAIGMVNGKAKLLRDDYCDGLGDCLPGCPVNAISFELREAEAYNEEAVKENLAKMNRKLPEASEAPTCLVQWPVQIRLIPEQAAYFNGTDLLIAADCAAYAYGDFHRRFMRGRVTLVGCPKLDPVDYSEKLTAILRENDVRSITLTRMMVPCCGGLLMAVKKAMEASGKKIPFQYVVLSHQGEILEERWENQ